MTWVICFTFKDELSDECGSLLIFSDTFSLDAVATFVVEIAGLTSFGVAFNRDSKVGVGFAEVFTGETIDVSCFFISSFVEESGGAVDDVLFE